MMMILVPFYEPRSRMLDLDGQIFQTSQEYWRSCGPNGILYASTKKPCIVYRNQSKAKHLQNVVWRFSVPWITQHLWSSFWWISRSYQDSCQTLRTILLAHLQGRCQKLDSPMCNLGSNKRFTDTVQGRLHKYNVRHKFERMAMDLARPFLISRRGNQHILAVAYYFSKWCEAYPVPIIDASEIAKVFVENWVPYYGVLLDLHTNQGRNF